MRGEFFEDVTIHTLDEIIRMEIADEIEWENDARFSDGDDALTEIEEGVIESKVRSSFLKWDRMYVRKDGRIEVRKKK